MGCNIGAAGGREGGRKPMGYVIRGRPNHNSFSLLFSPHLSLSGRWVAARDSGKDSPIAQLYSCPSRTTLKNVSDLFAKLTRLANPSSLVLPPPPGGDDDDVASSLPPRSRERERKGENGKWDEGGREGALTPIGYTGRRRTEKGYTG